MKKDFVDFTPNQGGGDSDKLNITASTNTDDERTVQITVTNQVNEAVISITQNKGNKSVPIHVIVGGDYGRLYNLKTGAFKESLLNGNLTTLFNIYQMSSNEVDLPIAGFAQGNIIGIYGNKSKNITWSEIAKVNFSGSLDLVQQLDSINNDDDELIISAPGSTSNELAYNYGSQVTNITLKQSTIVKQFALRTYAPMSGSNYLLLSVTYDGRLITGIYQKGSRSIQIAGIGTLHGSFTGICAGIGYRKSDDKFIVVDSIGRIYTKSSTGSFIEGILIAGSQTRTNCTKLTVGDNYTLVGTSGGVIYSSVDKLNSSMAFSPLSTNGLPSLELINMSYNSRTKYHSILFKQPVSGECMVGLFNDVTGEYDVFKFPNSEYSTYGWNALITSANTLFD